MTILFFFVLDRIFVLSKRNTSRKSVESRRFSGLVYSFVIKIVLVYKK